LGQYKDTPYWCCGLEAALVELSSILCGLLGDASSTTESFMLSLSASFCFQASLVLME
jgi:hypothetical protein